MRILTTELDGVLIIEPNVFSDSRGYFFESFQSERFTEAGLPTQFVQDNVSYSYKNVIRGLHYQLEKPQGKLVYVSFGKVLDVVVDIRRSSQNFGKAITVELSDTNHRQLYVPPGFAHGYCAISDTAVFMYKCTDYYHPASEHGVIWNDPDLQINWPVKEAAILSAKDLTYPRLKDVSTEYLPF